MTTTHPAAAPKPDLPIGISTLDFAGRTDATLAEKLAAAGFKTVQLFLSQPATRNLRQLQGRRVGGRDGNLLVLRPLPGGRMATCAPLAAIAHHHSRYTN